MLFMDEHSKGSVIMQIFYKENLNIYGICSIHLKLKTQFYYAVK